MGVGGWVFTYRERDKGAEGVAVDGDGLNEGQRKLDVAKGGPQKEGNDGRKAINGGGAGHHRSKIIRPVQRGRQMGGWGGR